MTHQPRAHKVGLRLAFSGKVRDVMRLYAGPPENAVFLSVDAQDDGSAARSVGEKGPLNHRVD